MFHLMKHKYLAFLLSTFVLLSCQTIQIQADPLPSWNDGKAKQAILKFVKEVTDVNNKESYVPPAERIAVFDNDGTLWAEKPTDFGYMFISHLIAQEEKLRDMQPFKAALEAVEGKNYEYFRNLGKSEAGQYELLKLVLGTHSGMNQREFQELAKGFLYDDNEIHPRFNVPYKELVYQPMLELLYYLRANDFKLFICTGAMVEFVRAFSEDTYGISRENVIGSSLRYTFQETDQGPVILRGKNNSCEEEMFNSYNNYNSKPENIQLHIGRVPIITVGNSDGDLQMMQYTDDGKGPSLMLLLHHDDKEEEHEYGYVEGAEKVLQVAKERIKEGRNWAIISIVKDFNRVFPFEKQSNSMKMGEK